MKKLNWFSLEKLQDSKKIGKGSLRDAVRAISSASEPDRVHRRVAHDLAKRRQPLAVWPGEMPVREKTLRMDGDFAVAALGDEIVEPVRRLAR